MKNLFHLFLFATLAISCGSDDLSSTRAYVEGKVKTETLYLEDLNISITSENKTVARTIPTSSGNFVLSGPLFSDGFSVNFNEKIKTFSASRSGCTLSEDSLSIIVPEGVSYITFSEITMQK